MSLTNNKSFVITKKAFESKEVRIRPKELIDPVSMFYNPYKKPVSFKSAKEKKVKSNKFVFWPRRKNESS